MNIFEMAFANSYNNGEKIRPDLATSYQATTPQPDYGFSFGGQSSGQTASQAPAPTPYTQEQANAYIAANPPAPAPYTPPPAPAPTFTIGGVNAAAPAPYTPPPAPASGGFAFGGQSMGQTAADAKDQYGFSQQQYGDIKANWEANRTDPNKIMSLMKDYGVDAGALSRATGVGYDEIGNYLKTNGAQNGFGGYSWAQTPASAPAPVATQLPAQPSVNLGMSNQTYTPNPYLDKQAEAIRSQVTQNLQRNIMPQISGNAQMVGGYGGSRQGVVEANALNDANQGLSNSLANLYGTDYTNAMNRNLQQQSLDNSYNLGLGNLGLNAQNSQNSFYTSQRGQDLQQIALGSQLAQAGNQGYLNQGTGIYDTGTAYQQAPWNTMNSFNQAATPYTGYGATSTVNQQNNPWASALGGAVAGAQFGRLF